MSFTAGNGAYITPAKNGWDVAEFSSSEAAFYFQASRMESENNWGTYSGWAMNYDTAIERLTGKSLKFNDGSIRLSEVAVNRKGFYGGSWIKRAAEDAEDRERKQQDMILLEKEKQRNWYGPAGKVNWSLSMTGAILGETEGSIRLTRGGNVSFKYYASG